MTTRRLLPVAAAIGLAAIAAPATAQPGPSGDVMKAAARSTVQIFALNCTGGEQSRAGSGFLWGANDRVVTDLHVVSGCATITVRSPATPDITSHVDRILPDADLVLLKLQQPIQREPLVAGTAVPKPTDVLQAIGYYYGVSTVDNRPLTVTIGSPILRDMITDTVKDSIRKAGYSTQFLSLDILRLDGNLVPGLSGAPVIDRTGRVVGIGSGGLEQGLSGIAWATQAHYLTSLAAAPQQPANSTGQVSSLRTSRAFFSATTDSGRDSIRCGDLKFFRTKSRTAAEILPTSDDQLAFAQLASTTGMNANEIGSLRFDIYSEASSGGSFAVPAGATFTSSGNTCRARVAGGTTEIQVFSAVSADPGQLNNAFIAFENQQMLGSPLRWQVDSSFTYPAPRPRLDGFLVFRKAARGTDNSFIQHGEAFETIMEKGNQAIGIVAINNDFNPQLYHQCFGFPRTDSCQRVMNNYVVWVAAGLGTNLSTYPGK